MESINEQDIYVWKIKFVSIVFCQLQKSSMKANIFVGQKPVVVTLLLWNQFLKASFIERLTISAESYWITCIIFKFENM